MTKSHTYRNYRIVRCSEVLSGGRGWSIDMQGEDSNCAEYSHGYATLAEAKDRIDRHWAGDAFQPTGGR